jgi:uncharacterized membrane protein YfcA
VTCLPCHAFAIKVLTGGYDTALDMSFELTPLFWVTACLAILMIGISKAGFGSGVGVVATPLMALTMPVAEAAALLLPILLIADVFAVHHYRKRFDVQQLAFLLPFATLGIGLGWLFFDMFRDNERLLKLSIGLIATLFVLYQAGYNLLLKRLTQQVPNLFWGTLLGFTAGFTSTLAHVGGPPLVMYLLPQRLPKDIFVGTCAVFFFLVNLLKLIPYAFLGLLDIGNIPLPLVLLPLTYVGIRLGVWLNRLVSERTFNLIVYLLLLLTGIQLIIDRNLMDFLR